MKKSKKSKEFVMSKDDIAYEEEIAEYSFSDYKKPEGKLIQSFNFNESNKL